MPHRVVSRSGVDQEDDISCFLAVSGEESYKFDEENKFRSEDTFATEIETEEEQNDEDIIAAQQLIANRKRSNSNAKNGKKSGGFQSFGLNSVLLKSVNRKGFAVPTPIQRKTIPLILDNQDVVGMARTGSGKTAAFVIPLIEKLKSHSVQVGARAIIMSPSRELALQTLKVVKDFGRGTDLRSVLLVGGENLEDQFSQMTSNPDIIIATPGRFMHLLVEMSLDISSARYVVFDEADRLFEMGFSIQLTELLHALPDSRQTLLFSATLPKSLVEFAKAGLREPRLVRLDAESKVSPDLQSVFLNLKMGEKEGALLHLLQDVICMPFTSAQKGQEKTPSSGNNRKRKRSLIKATSAEVPIPQSTIVFAATKHHVEYLTTLLQELGFSVSFVYGSLDQSARKSQIENFRSGITTILVVTDVAARGIDMPMLANVINYDFPSQPKVYIHRVGRTARAGQKGWSYSLLQDSDLPYLIDLQLFLGRNLIVGRASSTTINFADDMALGNIPRRKLEMTCETIGKIVEQHEALLSLRDVAKKGEKQYTRTRNPASVESAKRAKILSQNSRMQQVNMLYEDDSNLQDVEKDIMLARISGFRPSETVFEIGKRGKDADISQAMRKRKEKLQKLRRPMTEAAAESDVFGGHASDMQSVPENALAGSESDPSDMWSDEEFEVTFPEESAPPEQDLKDTWRDQDHFMSYAPKSVNIAEDRGYGVHSGSYNSTRDSNFASAAKDVVLDISNDETKSFAQPSKPRQVRWDKKSKKYVSTANDSDGSKGPRMINSESGQKIAATFRSGRFAAWKKAHQLERLPSLGENEASFQRTSRGLRNYKHYAARAPKAPDKYRDDYHKKKRKLEESQKGLASNNNTANTPELRGVDDIRKQRMLKDRRREKNGRPSRKRKPSTGR